MTDGEFTLVLCGMFIGGFITAILVDLIVLFLLHSL